MLDWNTPTSTPNYHKVNEVDWNANHFLAGWVNLLAFSSTALSLYKDKGIRMSDLSTKSYFFVVFCFCFWTYDLLGLKKQ